MTRAKGIVGILNQIVGAEGLSPLRHPNSDPGVDPAARAQQTPGAPRTDEPRNPINARRGRPLASLKEPAPPEPKAKITVWIGQRLIDQYCDWSWDARSHLSHLVEQALAAYHEQHRAQQFAGYGLRLTRMASDPPPEDAESARLSGLRAHAQGP
jgi:hypothetical protein